MVLHRGVYPSFMRTHWQYPSTDSVELSYKSSITIFKDPKIYGSKEKAKEEKLRTPLPPPKYLHLQKLSSCYYMN